MTYIDQWRSQFPKTIEHAAARIPAHAAIGPGLLAAVAVWPIRADIQAYEGDAIDAVRDVVGAGAGRLLKMMSGWSDDLFAVANDVQAQISSDAVLQAACTSLEARFDIATQLAARIAARLAPQQGNTTNFQGEIRAALLNVGGTVNISTLTIQVQSTAPDPAAQLVAALEALEALPTDAVPPPAPLPHPNRMPHRQNPQFVGRDADLVALAKLLKAQQTTAIVAATGIGGVGKTQLGSEFVHRYGRFFAGGVFWIDASSEAAMRADIAACGEPGALDLAGFGALPDLDAKVKRVQAEWQSAMPRLLVFDNLEEPRLLELAPTSGGCRVLLTARRTTWSKSIHTHPLDVLKRPDSLKLLLEPRYGDRWPSDLADADAICEALGDLPLAGALAGAFLEAAPSVSLKNYLRQITLEQTAHPSLNRELEEALPTKHRPSIIATFQLSYDQLNDATPSDALARTLLHRAAHCAPAPIPRRLLLRAAGYDPDDETSDNSADVDPALRRLAALGLISILTRPDETTLPPLRLHRLLAAYARSRATAADEDLLAVEQALNSELYAVNMSGYPQRGQPYLEHGLHCAPDAKKRGDETAATLLSNLGYLLQAQGELAGARPYLEQALAIYRQVLRDSHPDTATSLNNLGALLQAQGELAGARPYYEQALAIRRQVLGDSHPHTAQSLNNLGYLLQAQEELAGARPYYEQALAIYRQVLGDSHPDTARSLNNLGGLLQAQGDLAGARPYYEQALAIRRQVLGDSHPHTATSLNNLAMLCYYEGDIAEAHRLMRQALAINKQVLGPKHPDTQSSQQSLTAIEKRLRGRRWITDIMAWLFGR